MQAAKPKSQIRWKDAQVAKAAKMFMSGSDYSDISKATGFDECAVRHKLTLQGFTKEYRANKIGQSS